MANLDYRLDEYSYMPEFEDELMENNIKAILGEGTPEYYEFYRDYGENHTTIAMGYAKILNNWSKEFNGV